MRGKYAPLAAYLAAQSGETAVLSFAEIETLIGARLPRTARRPGWWSNSPESFPHARTWLASGWRVQTVNLAWRTVTFIRTEAR